MRQHNIRQRKVIEEKGASNNQTTANHKKEEEGNTNSYCMRLFDRSTDQTAEFIVTLCAFTKVVD